MRCAVSALLPALLAAAGAQARTIAIAGGAALPDLKMHVFHVAPEDAGARIVSVEREGAKPLEMRVFSGASAAPARRRAEAEPEKTANLRGNRIRKGATNSTTASPPVIGRIG